jgi:ArsR family transcriptional regulator
MKTITIKPDRLFKALSDKTRLRILNLLRGGELCVCDIVTVLDVPQPKASRHLAYLRKVGLVGSRKAGVWSYYQLAPASTDFEQRLQSCLECCGELPQFAKDSERLKRNRFNCCE